MLKTKIICLIFCVLILVANSFADWQKLNFPSNEKLCDVQFANEDVGWVLGENYLYKTEDGGFTWQIQMASLGLGVLYAKNEKSLYFSNYQYYEKHKTDGILRTVDGGERWQIVDCCKDYITEIEFVNENIGFAGGSNADYKALIKKTTNGGLTWQTICADFPETKSEITGISFIDEFVGWAISYYGVVYKTIDGGISWSLQDTLEINGASSMRDIEFTDFDNGIAVGGLSGQMKIWITHDGGESWNINEIMKNEHGSSMNKIQFLDENTCWMTGHGMVSDYSIAHSEDQGETWQGHYKEITSEPTYLGFQSFYMVNKCLGYFIANTFQDYEGSIYKYTNPLAIEDTENIIENFSLEQNYPNPFNPTTTISYTIPKTDLVNISVYDINGKLIETLVNSEKSAGFYAVKWNATEFSTGLYFYKISAGDFVNVKKCLYLK